MSDNPVRHDDLPEEMDRIVDGSAEMRQLSTGYKFLEGPVWLGDRLVFSDIPASKLYVWSNAGGADVFRQESNGGNGNTADVDGHLYTCEGETRCVSITEPRSAGRDASCATATSTAAIRSR